MISKLEVMSWNTDLSQYFDMKLLVETRKYTSAYNKKMKYSLQPEIDSQKMEAMYRHDFCDEKVCHAQYYSHVFFSLAEATLYTQYAALWRTTVRALCATHSINITMFWVVPRNEKWMEKWLSKGEHRQSAHPIILPYLLIYSKSCPHCYCHNLN